MVEHRYLKIFLLVQSSAPSKFIPENSFNIPNGSYQVLNQVMAGFFKYLESKILEAEYFDV